LNRQTNKSSLLTLIRENWTWAAPALYVYVTGIGMALSWSRYKSFELNIFDFAELNDFLLAAFREPIALFGVVLMIGYWLFITWIGQAPLVKKILRFKHRALSNIGLPLTLFFDVDRLRRFWVTRYRKQLRLRNKIYRLARRPAAFLLIALLVPLFVSLVFWGMGKDDILHNSSSRVDVIVKGLANNPNGAELKNILLIGTTDRFAFFYNEVENIVIIVPVANILLAKLWIDSDRRVNQGRSESGVDQERTAPR